MLVAAALAAACYSPPDIFSLAWSSAAPEKASGLTGLFAVKRSGSCARDGELDELLRLRPEGTAYGFVDSGELRFLPGGRASEVGESLALSSKGALPGRYECSYAVTFTAPDAFTLDGTCVEKPGGYLAGWQNRLPARYEGALGDGLATLSSVAARPVTVRATNPEGFEVSYPSLCNSVATLLARRR